MIRLNKYAFNISAPLALTHHRVFEGLSARHVLICHSFFFAKMLQIWQTVTPHRCSLFQSLSFKPQFQRLLWLDVVKPVQDIRVACRKYQGRGPLCEPVERQSVCSPVFVWETGCRERLYNTRWSQACRSDSSFDQRSSNPVDSTQRLCPKSKIESLETSLKSLHKN